MVLLGRQEEGVLSVHATLHEQRRGVHLALDGRRKRRIRLQSPTGGERLEPGTGERTIDEHAVTAIVRAERGDREAGIGASASVATTAAVSSARAPVGTSIAVPTAATSRVAHDSVDARDHGERERRGETQNANATHQGSMTSG